MLCCGVEMMFCRVYLMDWFVLFLCFRNLFRVLEYVLLVFFWFRLIGISCIFVEGKFFGGVSGFVFLVRFWFKFCVLIVSFVFFFFSFGFIEFVVVDCIVRSLLILLSLFFLDCSCFYVNYFLVYWWLIEEEICYVWGV